MAKENCQWRIQDHSGQTPIVSRSGNMHPIGVFDSGVGGLSVLHALSAELPHESLVYVADSRHAPYGERDDAFIIARSHAITDYLLQHHAIKALVVACNTATAASIHTLRSMHPDLPIIGIEPALKPAVAISRTGRIGVMATRGTLGSEKFKTLYASLKDQAEFILQPCDGLADAIERDDQAQILRISTDCMQNMGSFGHAPGAIDTLVLGCTHYPFIASTLQNIAGCQLHFLEGGEPVARQTKRVITLAPTNAKGELQFFSIGTSATLFQTVKRWMHCEQTVHTITI